MHGRRRAVRARTARRSKPPRGSEQNHRPMVGPSCSASDLICCRSRTAAAPGSAERDSARAWRVVVDQLPVDRSIQHCRSAWVASKRCLPERQPPPETWSGERAQRDAPRPTRRSPSEQPAKLRDRDACTLVRAQVLLTHRRASASRHGHRARAEPTCSVVLWLRPWW